MVEERTPADVARMARDLGDLDLVVAIDGPAASGKSTAGQLLAHRLGYLYINSGAMYRAAAWRLRDLGIPADQPQAVAFAVEAIVIRYLPPDGDDPARILVDGTDVSSLIGTADIGQMASAVSAIPAVRRRLVAIQQQTGIRGRVVMDGRDIGSKVFPGAEVKFYLDAGLEVRAARRRLELLERGERLPLGEVSEQLARRDHNDSTRDDSPLVRTPDAVVVDSAALGPDEVVDYMIRKMHVMIC
jgi:cytidylate kinase